MGRPRLLMPWNRTMHLSSVGNIGTSPCTAQHGVRCGLRTRYRQRGRYQGTWASEKRLLSRTSMFILGDTVAGFAILQRKK